jgi:hypothetical protein
MIADYNGWPRQIILPGAMQGCFNAMPGYAMMPPSQLHGVTT